MRGQMLLAIGVLLWAGTPAAPLEAATITWSNSHPEGPALAVDYAGDPLWGTTEFGPAPDLSLGALVQLWHAVGEIDDPWPVMAAYESTDWAIDDILLDESHMGFGTFTHPNGSWSDTGDYSVNEGDIVYARVYEVSKPDFAATPLAGRNIGIRDKWGEIVYQTVGEVKNPQTLYFDHLCAGCIPEPSALLLVIPGLAIWALRRRCSGVAHDSSRN